MLKSQFDFMCNSFGDPDLPDNEKWKAIRYIFIEFLLLDAQILIKKGEFIYIDNPIIGPGFYILGVPNSDIESIVKGNTITFISLSSIDKISLKVNLFSKLKNISGDELPAKLPFILA